MGLFSKTVHLKDASVTASSTGVEIRCRNLFKRMSFNDFAEWIYPLINEAAKSLDKPTKP